jgi:hypothetical protein
MLPTFICILVNTYPSLHPLHTTCWSTVTGSSIGIQKIAGKTAYRCFRSPMQRAQAFEEHVGSRTRLAGASRIELTLT